MADERPESISGGCLCGSIKFDISFTGDAVWPPLASTCQCSMCRKWTGCLVSHDLIVKKSQVTPLFESFSTFTLYDSSPGTQRAFCSKCGGGVAWFNEYIPEDVIIFVGTIDEEYLLGKPIENTIKEDEHGSTFKREGGLAKVLTDSSTAGNLYWHDAIPGKTDHFDGPKFLQHFIDKVPLTEGQQSSKM